MEKILVLYSTTDGHTQKISQSIKTLLSQNGCSVTMMSVDDREALVLESFDKIVIGASIRYGKHGKKISDLIVKNKQVLNEIPTAFFSVNLVARKPEKCDPETNPYFFKFLKQVGWQPNIQAVFAGKIDYKKYGFWDRKMIRFIMYLTKGPVNLDAVIEYTDWKQVDAFVSSVVEMK